MSTDSTGPGPRRQTARDNGGEEAPVEAPEADAAEQHASVNHEENDWLDHAALDTDRTVSEADAVEQLIEVDLDEDDYR